MAGAAHSVMGQPHDARVERGETVHHGPRAVAAGIVHQDDFQPRQALFLHRSHGFGQPGRAVVHRDHHRDLGRLRPLRAVGDRHRARGLDVIQHLLDGAGGGFAGDVVERIPEVSGVKQLLQRAPPRPVRHLGAVVGQPPARVPGRAEADHAAPRHQRLEADLRGADIDRVHRVDQAMGVHRLADQGQPLFGPERVEIARPAAAGPGGVGVGLDQDLGLRVLGPGGREHGVEGARIHPPVADRGIVEGLVADQHPPPRRGREPHHGLGVVLGDAPGDDARHQGAGAGRRRLRDPLPRVQPPGQPRRVVGHVILREVVADIAETGRLGPGPVRRRPGKGRAEKGLFEEHLAVVRHVERQQPLRALLPVRGILEHRAQHQQQRAVRQLRLLRVRGHRPGQQPRQQLRIFPRQQRGGEADPDRAVPQRQQALPGRQGRPRVGGLALARQQRGKWAGGRFSEAEFHPPAMARPHRTGNRFAQRRQIVHSLRKPAMKGGIGNEKALT